MSRMYMVLHIAAILGVEESIKRDRTIEEFGQPKILICQSKITTHLEIDVVRIFHLLAKASRRLIC